MKELLEGKVKTVFSTDDPNVVLIQYEDKVTAGNGSKVDFPEGKGQVCCGISKILFEKMKENNIETHYLSIPPHGVVVTMDSSKVMCCRKVNIIPIEVVVRNFVAGSLCRQTYLREGIALNPPLVEFYLKDDDKNDPLLTIDRMERMGYSEILYSLLISNALKVNDVLKEIFSNIDLDLIDFKLEFGHDSENGHLLLVDELSPDSMRLWKKGTRERFDKDLFRNDEGDIVEAYKHILKQLEQFA